MQFDLNKWKVIIKAKIIVQIIKLPEKKEKTEMENRKTVAILGKVFHFTLVLTMRNLCNLIC